MSDLSEKCCLSQIYTNHSIRITGITVLTNASYSNADIMSVSGHKSVQSLAVYQKTDKKKIKMGKTMFNSMTGKENELQKIEPGPQIKELPPAPSTMQVVAIQNKSETAMTPQPNVASEIIPFEPNFKEDGIADIDLLSAICGVEANINSPAKPPVTLSNNVENTSNVITQIPKSFFTKCHIGTINLNIIQKMKCFHLFTPQM